MGATRDGVGVGATRDGVGATEDVIGVGVTRDGDGVGATRDGVGVGATRDGDEVGATWFGVGATGIDATGDADIDDLRAAIDCNRTLYAALEATLLEVAELLKDNKECQVT